MAPTFTYCSFLMKYYGLSSRTHWNSLPFTTPKITSVTDSDRNVKEINPVMIKPIYKWPTELERNPRRKMAAFSVITQARKKQLRQMYVTWYSTSTYFFFFTFWYTKLKSFRVPINTFLCIANLPRLCLRNHSSFKSPKTTSL